MTSGDPNSASSWPPARAPASPWVRGRGEVSARRTHPARADWPSPRPRLADQTSPPPSPSPLPSHPSLPPARAPSPPRSSAGTNAASAGDAARARALTSNLMYYLNPILTQILAFAGRVPFPPCGAEVKAFVVKLYKADARPGRGFQPQPRKHPTSARVAFFFAFWWHIGPTKILYGVIRSED